MQKHLDCGRLIKQIHDEMGKRANNALRSQDMTVVQLEALIQLDAAPEKCCSLKELERQLHVAQSTTVGIIARLEQKGLVKSFSDQIDRRVKLVQITQAGLDCLKKSTEGRNETESTLLSALTETEKEIFYVLLKKVRDSFN